MVEKLTLHYLATALVDIPAVCMPIARSLKTRDICGIVLCDTCVMIMLSNQLLDMSHLSDGWIILAKEKCSLTAM